MNTDGSYNFIKDSQLLYTTLDGKTVKFEVLKLTSDTLQLLAEESNKVLLMQRN